MTERGTISGATARDRAVAIAGLLAELGVGSLTLCANGRMVVRQSRVTDLPGEIVGGAPCELEATVGGETLVIRATAEGAEWRASRGLADRIVRLSPRAG